MLKEINKNPYHVGIIIDGNRRWAKERGLPSFEGHRRGFDKLKKVWKWCQNRGVKVLTIYAFSTENWKRPKKEVSFLMKLFKKALSKEVDEINKDGIKLQIIGQKDMLPKVIQNLINEAEFKTKDNKKGVLNLAISYGGYADIINAVKKIIKKKVSINKITAKTIQENLWTAGLPNPDLIIRTSGEQRLSGFLTWQSAYSELYFLEKNWPDFNEKDLDEAFDVFKNRKRRFGK